MPPIPIPLEKSAKIVLGSTFGGSAFIYGIGKGALKVFNSYGPPIRPTDNGIVEVPNYNAPPLDGAADEAEEVAPYAENDVVRDVEEFEGTSLPAEEERVAGAGLDGAAEGEAATMAEIEPAIDGVAYMESAEGLSAAEGMGGMSEVAEVVTPLGVEEGVIGGVGAVEGAELGVGTGVGVGVEVGAGAAAAAGGTLGAVATTGAWAVACELGLIIAGPTLGIGAAFLGIGLLLWTIFHHKHSDEIVRRRVDDEGKSTLLKALFVPRHNYKDADMDVFRNMRILASRGQHNKTAAFSYENGTQFGQMTGTSGLWRDSGSMLGTFAIPLLNGKEMTGTWISVHHTANDTMKEKFDKLCHENELRHLSRMEQRRHHVSARRWAYDLLHFLK